MSFLKDFARLFGGGLVGAMIGSRKDANKDLDKVLAQDPMYAQNPLAAQQFALAQQYMNAKMPGANQLEDNISTTQGNNLDFIRKNATDASQAIGAAAGTGAQADQAFSDLQTKEAGFKTSMLGNLNDAYGTLIGEGDKVYGDKVRRFGDTVQVRGAQSENKQKTWQDIINLGTSLLGFGKAGGFKIK